ncbi:lipopolysaccharide biosynthesis protein [Sphingorhabdus buctiana]|uniref:Lipopolysaccharide biosynthesis protein n=1 Tax=Sphingorhabdus buctiana TaxID=1508805 RepID=A0ABW4M8F0_9SPHN
MDEAALQHRGIVRRIYGNLGLLLGGKAAAGVISLVYIAIAARVLGPEGYGVLVLINYYAMFVGGLIAFPGWHAIVRYGVLALADGDEAKLIRLLRFVGAIEIAVGVLAVCVAALLAPIVGGYLGWTAQAQMLAIPYSLAVLATVRATPGGYLQILRRFDILGAHNIITPIMRLIGTLVVVAFGWGLSGFIIAWLIAALTEGISLWLLGIYLARRHMADQPLLGKLTDVRNEHPGLLRFTISANTDIMLSELVNRITPLVMGWVLGPAAAGLYSIAHRTTVVIAQPAQILGQAAYAELAKLVATGASGKNIRHALMRCVGISFLAALPIMLILAFFSEQISILIAGPAFAAAASVMIWLALARVLALSGPPTSAALIALGRPGLSVSSNIITSLGLLPLLPLLTAAWGLEGAGMHAVIQSILASGLLGLLLWRCTREQGHTG